MNNITLETLERVMKITGADYFTAKEALEKTDGDAYAAVKLIMGDDQDISEDVNEMINNLKKKVNEGNVDRIQIKKGDEVILNIPVTVGIVGGLLGLYAAPWALIAGCVAAFGFGCKLVVVKKDGSTDEVKR